MQYYHADQDVEVLLNLRSGDEPDPGKIPGHQVSYSGPDVAAEDHLDASFSRRLEGHTVAAAMEHRELTEEEAYFLLRYAGRMGYDKAITRLRPGWRWRRWLISVLGWETPEILQWDMGMPSWRPRIARGDALRWRSPYPILLLGSRVRLYRGRLHLRDANLVLSVLWRPRWTIYTSPDGSPSHRLARVWLGKIDD